MTLLVLAKLKIQSQHNRIAKLYRLLMGLDPRKGVSTIVIRGPRATKIFAILKYYPQQLTAS